MRGGREVLGEARRGRGLGFTKELGCLQMCECERERESESLLCPQRRGSEREGRSGVCSACRLNERGE